ncbi:MAG: ribonuclease III [Actinomycetales bacterium]|nr:ribonuclease III [Actinomycetales bacterium]
MNLDVLSTRLGVEIEPQLLELALTHRSYAYEHGNQPNNERLEFLGDAVLGFVIAAQVFHELTDLPEGELSKVTNTVVSAKALAQVGTSLGLGEFLRLGKGEEQTGGRQKANLIADAFEAIIGAAYISRGLDEATGIIERFVFPLLADPDAIRANADPKTNLQEFLQSNGKKPHLYEITHEGPDHDRTFFAVLLVDGVEVSRGQGRSKKAAETEAAVVALEKLAPKTKS